MENLFTYSLTVFTGFFAVMNPIANVPIFLGLTHNKKQSITHLSYFLTLY